MRAFLCWLLGFITDLHYSPFWCRCPECTGNRIWRKTHLPNRDEPWYKSSAKLLEPAHSRQWKFWIKQKLTNTTRCPSQPKD